ncbi:MAG: RNase adapter RapZ [Deltaproteobacteria bacterium]|nr:RNase adapter RapZ [Deltaproteobacteria bacterium]MCL5792117.1 RNase adapter RapZ [Deltaproteobacteria bacterium]
MQDKQHLNIVIITGMSGSGKTSAMAILEDAGFFCIDNIPVQLIPKSIELIEASKEDIKNAALSIDVRGRGFFTDLVSEIIKLKSTNKVTIIFLDSSDNVLLKRYSETRRKHPLAHDIPIEHGFALERKYLEEIKSQADHIIDTSNFTVHDLKRELRLLIKQMSKEKSMTIVLQSFGYRYGIPLDSDIIFDIRFLQNPYFVESLKKLSGLDNAVIDYIKNNNTTKEFLELIRQYVGFSIPLYESEGKGYLTISFGCTGGRHRSVTIVEEVRGMIESIGYKPVVKHRDIEKG